MNYFDILNSQNFFKFVEKSKLLFDNLISQDFWQKNSTHFDISNFANFLDFFFCIFWFLKNYDFSKQFWRFLTGNFFRICSFYFCKVVTKIFDIFINRTFLTEKLELFGNFVFSDILRFFLWFWTEIYSEFLDDFSAKINLTNFA